MLLVTLAGPASADNSGPRPGPIERRLAPVLAANDPIYNADRKRALAQADSLLRVAGEQRDVIGDAVARFTRARILTRQYGLEKVRADLDSVETLARAMRDTCVLVRVSNTVGLGEQMAGDMDAAVKRYRQSVRLARAVGFTRMEGFAHRGLGYAAKQKGDYQTAKRELELAIQQMPPKMFEHLHARLLYAETLNRLGRHDEAKEQLEGVLADARARKDRWNTAAALNDLGIIAFEQGDMAMADRNWEYAAAVFDSFGSAPSAVNSRINRAHALIHLERWDDGRALLQRLQAQSATMDPAVHLGVVGELGRLERRAGRPQEAERLLRRVRAEAFEFDTWAYDAATIELAGVLRETGRPAAAEAVIDSLLAPRKAEFMHDDLAAAWMEKSAALRAQGRPADALTAARQAERLTRRTGDEVSIYWLDASIELARCQREVGRADSAAATLARAARSWEGWRARISDLEWRERVASGLASLFAEYGLALLDARRSVPESRRVREAFDALQAFQARTLEERMHGQGLSSRAMTGRVSADSLRRGVLRQGELLLDIVSTPETTFVFALTRSGIEARLLPGARRLDRLFEDWREAMLAGAETPAVEAGLRRLSTELLAPIAASLAPSQRVVLSGGGSIALWPVAALTIPGESAPVGQTREIVSTPSATMFALLRRRVRVTSGPVRVLAISRVTNAAGRPLPGAERELRMLGSEYEGVTVRQSRGEQSVAELTSDLSRWGALHFAAHSEADDSSPWRSGFLLGRGDGDAAYFRASGVAGMHLQARVAVLSGCQSAGVAPLAGEGARGLSAAFLCAGTASVVATLWPVEDRTAERFMTAFYAAIADGRTVAAAVREARNTLRARPETASPRAWSAFVAVGEPGTVLPLKRRGGARPTGS